MPNLKLHAQLLFRYSCIKYNVTASRIIIIKVYLNVIKYYFKNQDRLRQPFSFVTMNCGSLQKLNSFCNLLKITFFTAAYFIVKSKCRVSIYYNIIKFSDVLPYLQRTSNDISLKGMLSYDS